MRLRSLGVSWAVALAVGVAGLAEEAAPLRITGRVTTADGEPLAGVTVRASEGLPAPVTDAAGRYEVLVPAEGEKCVLAPEKAGYTFEPPRAEVWLSGADAQADFRATGAGAPLAGIGPAALYSCKWGARGVKEQRYIENPSKWGPAPLQSYVRVYLRAGTKYAFETSEAVNSPKCTDTFMALYRTWSGDTGPDDELISNDDDTYMRPAADSKYSAFTYTPTTSRYYYVHVRSASGEAGYYHLKYDYAYTYQPLAQDKTVEGIVHDSSPTMSRDHAFFRVWLSAGKAYTVETSEASASQCTNTVLTLCQWWSGTDGPYNQVATDDNSGAGFYSKIVHTPAAKGYYFIHVRGYHGYAMRFNIKVTPP